MAPCVFMLLLACALPTAGELPADRAVEVYRYGFEENIRESIESLPADWTRRRGPGFPRYSSVTVNLGHAFEGEHCLLMTLDGGSVGVYSPPQPATDEHRWQAEVTIRTDRLKHDGVRLALVFLDAQHQPLETVASPPIQNAADWQQLRVGPVAPQHEQTRWVKIGLLLEPLGKESDLTGSASFDAVSLRRLPQVRVETADRQRIYLAGKSIQIECRASGFADEPPAMSLAVTDALGRAVDARIAEQRSVVATERGPTLARGLAPSSTTSEARKIADPRKPAEPRNLANEQPRSLPPRAQRWRIDGLEPGYYRIRVDGRAAAASSGSNELCLAVIEPVISHATQGQFGWVIDDPAGIPDRGVRLIGQAGVSRIKIPILADGGRGDRRDKLLETIDAWGTQRIRLVAVIDRFPPANKPAKADETDAAAANSVLPTALDLCNVPGADYAAALEPLMAKIAWQVDAWQWGVDGDTSCMGYAALNEKLAGVKKAFDQISGDANLGLPWSADHWNDRQITDPRRPWRFAALMGDHLQQPTTTGAVAPVASAPATSGGVQASTSGPTSTAGHLPARWVTLQLSAAEAAPLERRVDQLIERMLTAKLEGAASVFVADPFNPANHLAHVDGTPGEMFLPWRTTATLLDGANYLGQLTLPAAIDNHLFARGDQGVLVVRADQPRQASLYLGNAARQLDAWGRPLAMPKVDGRQTLAIARSTSFVTGLDLPVARWRLACRTLRPYLETQFGARQGDALVLHNTFDRVATGTVHLHPPAGWRVHPTSATIRLEAGENVELPIEWILPWTGDTGRQLCRIECELTTDRVYHFDSWIEIHVGDNLVQQTWTQQRQQGRLSLVQRLSNQTDRPRTFRCYCDAPGQRRQRSHVVVPAAGSAEVNYSFDDQGALKGETVWLRADEVSGSHRLSQRMVIEE